MACTQPYKAWKIGLTPSGKADLLITPYEVDHIEIPSRFPDKSKIFRALDASIYRPGWKVNREFLQIPCGQCVACRLEYSRQWANRCMLELQYHDSAYFVTLTYDEEHIPISYYTDDATGEAFPVGTLRKRDLQLFMKRLRFKFGENIRFFAAGEYGSDTFRPHYHLIIFGLHLDDLQVYKQQRGFTYYNSPGLQDVWSVNIGSNRCPRYEPLGYAVVAPVTWETCAYTARYVMKKLKGPLAEWYDYYNIEPPFTLMSRNPGIAHRWYVDHPDFNEYEYINVSTENGGRKFRPPRYLNYLYDIEYPEESAILKESRKQMAIKAQELKLSRTDLPYLEYLQVEEQILNDKVSRLIRSDI